MECQDGLFTAGKGEHVNVRTKKYTFMRSAG